MTVRMYQESFDGLANGQDDEMETKSPNPPKPRLAGKPTWHCGGKPRPQDARPPSTCGFTRSKDSCFVLLTRHTRTDSC